MKDWKKLLEYPALLALCFFYKCPFRLIFDRECPGCGMTRALLSFLRLDVKAAFHYHCLFPLVILTGIYYVFRKPLRRRFHLGSRQEDTALLMMGLLFLGRWGIRTFV